MLTDYIQTAMNLANYEIFKNDESYYGEIQDLKGVWANAETLEACRKELQEVLEGWLILRLSKGLEIPEIAGISLKVQEQV